MPPFPRGEIASSEVLTFEIASETGIYSEGVLTAAGAGAAAIVGAALSSTDLDSAGAAAWSATAAALAQAAMTAAGTAASTFPASSLVQGDLVCEGAAQTDFDGVVFMARIPLGDDPMARAGEQRDMTRPAESRAMEEPGNTQLARPAEHPGMTK